MGDNAMIANDILVAESADIERLFETEPWIVRAEIVSKSEHEIALQLLIVDVDISKVQGGFVRSLGLSEAHAILDPRFATLLAHLGITANFTVKLTPTPLSQRGDKIIGPVLLQIYSEGQET